MQANYRDVAAGGVFIAIAGLFALGTLDLKIGTALRMGPGYFPLLLAGVLAVIGAVILIKAIGRPNVSLGEVSWRGSALILIAPIVFGLTVRWLGLAPSVALAVLIASFASRRSTVKLAVILTLTLTVFCVVVFQKMLGVPIPIFAGPLDSLNAVVAPVFALFGA